MKFFILLLSVCFIVTFNDSFAQSMATESIQADLYLLNQDNTMALADNVSTKSVSNDNSDIVVYTSSIEDGAINLQFTNMPKGVYNITLKTSFGQLIIKESINYNGVRNIETVHFNKIIARGIYELEISKPGNAIKSTYNVEY